ncbi:unnamed protein product [Sphagnum balticum]
MPGAEIDAGCEVDDWSVERGAGYHTHGSFGGVISVESCYNSSCEICEVETFGYACSSNVVSPGDNISIILASSRAVSSYVISVISVRSHRASQRYYAPSSEEIGISRHPGTIIACTSKSA